MTIDPEIVGRALDAVDLKIEDNQGFYRVELPNGVASEGTSSHCLDVLHGFLIWDLMRSHAGHPLMHGATVVIDGKRLLITGDKGTGKTTLALFLLTRGHTVEGDEHQLILPDSVVARPRTLRVKPQSLNIIDGLPPIISLSPLYPLQNGTPVYAVNPAIFGRPWRITAGPLHGVVFAQSNHGGRSVAARLSVDEAFGRLMANSYFLKSGYGGYGQIAGRLRRLAQETPGYLLRLGDLESAEWHLRMIAAT